MVLLTRSSAHWRRPSSLWAAIVLTILAVGCEGAPQSTSSSAPPSELESQELLTDQAVEPEAPLPDDTTPAPDFNTEAYDRIYENPFMAVVQEPLSTFSIDVDTASYANTRRFLTENRLPPPDAVRLEELINYFSYDYPQPTGDEPFSITTELAVAPWNPEHELLLVGLQGQQLDTEVLPPNNLVFLLDVSGSMDEPNKLPLLKAAIKLLAEQMDADDRVAIVVYAGAAGLVLEPTPGSETSQILAAIEALEAGGSTAGGAGIELAYQVAKENFLPEGNNRVILATDGDFNVGPSSDGELVRLIEGKRDDGIFLTVLGLGTGNYQDSKMEQLANQGNGNYAYLDSLLEAKKALVTEMGGTLVAIAKDVKLQIEFNPTEVKAYRLLGYENRLLEAQDFNDDQKDAGELGAGHSVTALYELIPADSAAAIPGVDPLQYQESTVLPSDDLLTLKLRYQQPDGDTSQLVQQALQREEIWQNTPSANMQFASAVAEFGLLLRNSEYKADADYEAVFTRATQSQGADFYGYRAEFLDLVQQADLLSR
ncbi:MAG: von Willebrand factor type A domain-containing protein [Leptolyngbyaceae cyanobacterium]